MSLKLKQVFERMRPHTQMWLQTLPPGNYTVIQLCKHAGTDRSVIQRTFKKFDVDHSFVPAEYKNVQNILWHWKGVDYYIKSPMTADQEPIY
jgi:hypothetical protein